MSIKYITTSQIDVCVGLVIILHHHVLPLPMEYIDIFQLLSAKVKTQAKPSKLTPHTYKTGNKDKIE